MTTTNHLTTAPIHRVALGKLMLIGASIGLVLIVLFLAAAGEPNPEWGASWRIKPLIMEPFAGAMGGVCYYILDHLRYQGGWKKILANILSLLIFIVGLWLGSVLGLNGTYWN